MTDGAATLPYDPMVGLPPERCLRDMSGLQNKLGHRSYLILQEACDVVEDTSLDSVGRMHLAASKLLQVDNALGSTSWRADFATILQGENWKALILWPTNMKVCSNVLREAGMYYNKPVSELRQINLIAAHRESAAKDIPYGQWITVVPTQGAVAHCIERPGDKVALR